MLDVQGLDLHYGNSQILYNVSTTATAGEVTAILGTNGVGKTSLIRALAGTHQRTKGEIFLDGERLNILPPHVLASKAVSYTHLTLPTKA